MQNIDKINALIDEAIMLDLEEISITKQSKDRNTRFALENAKMANTSLRQLSEFKRLFRNNINSKNK